MTIQRGAIVLGFTGSIGSGCTYISKTISDISSHYKYFKLSNIIRESLKEKGNTTPTVEDLQIEGNELRNYHGNEVLVAMTINQLNSSTKNYTHLIIDGIKNDHEVNYLKQFPNFYLFSVNADRDIRKERVVGLEEGKHFSSPEEFIKADVRDEKENSINGQQVKKCNELSDIVIVNEENITSTSTKRKKEYVNKIISKYVDLIENHTSGKSMHENFPSVDELCMTIAYALSKKSSCLKRKVGAVIIEEDNKLPEEKERIEKEGRAIRIPNIVATGYNEVPMGTHKCIFNPEQQKCYRDHLQEEHARTMKFCASCGEKIGDIVISCPKCHTSYDHFVNFCTKCQTEIKYSYKCPNCDSSVFEEHLPGSKKTPGKLLDLCKALHGEEMAILQLTKRSTLPESILILYVTTQPCNLCANKIATAGIKKVVYSEPYTMKESAEILDNGGVALERFQGVKSSAYFKLYN
jgi:deoxycytidylate deaminase